MGGKGPNLGRFALRETQENEELRVGVLWHQQQQQLRQQENEANKSQTHSGPQDITLNNNNQPVISNPRNNVSQAVQHSDKKTGSLTSKSTSSDSQSLAQSLLETQLSTSCMSSLNTDKLNSLQHRLLGTATNSTQAHNPSDNQCSQATDADSDSLLQTQVPRSQILRDLPLQDDTYESVVVDVNPETFRTSSEATTENHEATQNYVLYTPFSRNKRKQKKKYPKQMPHETIMSHVTFALSGYENPRRSKIRDMAIAMGAHYSPNWNRLCTHLICAFKFTPKFKQAVVNKKRVVREHWIAECSKQSQLLDWRPYKLGDYELPDSEEEVDTAEDLDFALARSEQIEANRQARVQQQAE